MARIRTIKPSFYADEDVASVAYQWRLLFIGLWLHADREGRLEDRPARLKAMLFPYDDLDVESGLGCLVNARLIVRYEGDGKRLIAIPGFSKHQQPHVKEAHSVLPAPAALDKTGASTVLAAQEGKGTDQDQEGKEISAEPLRGSTPAGESPTILEFPVVGADGQTWRLTERQIQDWQALFETVDVRRESRQALAWVTANPGRRKTGRGMPKFLVGWFSRAVDSGRGRSAASVPVQVGSRWSCPHVEHCSHRAMCEGKLLLPEKYAVKAVSA